MVWRSLPDEAVWHFKMRVCVFDVQLDIALAFHRREPTPFVPVKLLIITESPIGLINLKEICQFGTCSAKHLRLTGVTFGSEDFLARLGKYM